MKYLLMLGFLVCTLQVKAEYRDDSSTTTTTTNTTVAVPPPVYPAVNTTTDPNAIVDPQYQTDGTTTNMVPATNTATTYSGTSTTTNEHHTMGLPSGWAGFLGLSSGYTANNNDIPVEGVPNEIKLLGSYTTEGGGGVFDLGVGTHTQTFIDPGAIEKNTTTSTMELAARYQFESRWQLGVVYNQFFNRGENYFSNQADAEFGGIQLMKEFGTHVPWRLGLRAMRDINTENQDIDMAMIDLGIGLSSY